jgi:hypothetical protein
MIRTIGVLLALCSLLNGQQVTSGDVQAKLTAKLAATTYIPGDASVQDTGNATKDAVKNAAIGVGTGHALMAIAQVSLPGAIAASALSSLPFWRKSRSKSADQGMQMTRVLFLQGLSAPVSVSPGNIVLTLPPDQLVAGGQPISDLKLFRVEPSEKNAARIVLSSKVIVRPTGNPMNPMQVDVLNSLHEEVPCTQTAKDGGVTLTPNSPLAAGEYSLIAVIPLPFGAPPGAENMHAAWDFRVK